MKKAVRVTGSWTQDVVVDVPDGTSRDDWEWAARNYVADGFSSKDFFRGLDVEPLDPAGLDTYLSVIRATGNGNYDYIDELTEKDIATIVAEQRLCATIDCSNRAIGSVYCADCNGLVPATGDDT